MPFSFGSRPGVVTRAVETVRPILDAHRHQLGLDLPDGPVYLNGDPVRLAGLLEDGTTKFDPLAVLLAPDVSTLSDSATGVEEHETTGRKEIFATLPSGQLQTIVMITERGKWVLHRTRIPEPFDPPK